LSGSLAESVDEVAAKAAGKAITVRAATLMIHSGEIVLFIEVLLGSK
jgi:hypothetical protein